VPYPVDRRVYYKSIKILREAIEGAEIEREVRLKALRNLAIYARTLYPD